MQTSIELDTGNIHRTVASRTNRRTIYVLSGHVNWTVGRCTHTQPTSRHWFFVRCLPNFASHCRVCDGHGAWAAVCRCGSWLWHLRSAVVGTTLEGCNWQDGAASPGLVETCGDDFCLHWKFCRSCGFQGLGWGCYVASWNMLAVSCLVSRFMRCTPFIYQHLSYNCKPYTVVDICHRIIKI